ncbi:LURP-one-related/scramblase family protein [Natrinema ejinorense]|uniref:Uncharacterized protein n=1 Tax=Natrinema ejinorense TaxID=373386 RepID=A0A2A5QUJ0_9EURY|nr:hypothetical protein [Natrinema ejinorense]PCR90497.1 hypothetical protein CP557_08180 [Natrinema ejinorense]
MKEPKQYEITGLGLSGTQYTVEQTGTDKNFRPEYEARDVTGDTIFRCTYNMYEEKDELPFVDADGDELFTVKASETWDIAGDYLLTDSQTGEDIVVLDNDFSLFQDTWRIRDAEDESLIAEINSRGALFTVGRKILPVGQWIGHRFKVTDPEGNSVGTIESGFAVFDQYEITIRDRSSVPVDPVLAGAVVIDAIQEN